MAESSRGAARAGEVLRAKMQAAVGPIAERGRSIKQILAEKLKLKERPRLRGALRNIRHPLTALATAPLRAGQSLVANTLLGPKAVFGPMKGKRVRAVPGGPGEGLRIADPKRAEDIKSGKVRGKLVKGRAGMKRYLFERKYRPGGLVGKAIKHPVIAGGGGLLAYYLMKNPQARAAAGQAAGGAARSSGDFSPETLARFKQQQANENPLAREVWK